MKKILLALVLVVCIPCYANPLQMHLSGGFLTARDYLAMPEAQKRAYAMGSINGMLLAPLFGAPESKVKWLETCVAGMTDDQIAAILTKYIEDHPDQWHWGMHILAYSAMCVACKR